MVCLHLSPQVFYCPKLKLLHCALAPAHLLRDLANALLLYKPQMNDPELSLRQPVHQLKQHGVALRFGGLDWVRRWRLDLTPQAFEVVRDSMRRNPQQPCAKGSPSPFVLPDSGQGLAENVRGQVFGLMPVPYTADHVAIDPIEMLLVKLAKARRVALRGFH